MAGGQGRSFWPTPDLRSWNLGKGALGAWGKGWGPCELGADTGGPRKPPPHLEKGDCEWPVLVVPAKHLHARDLRGSDCFSDPLSAPWTLLVHAAAGSLQGFCSKRVFSVGVWATRRLSWSRVRSVDTGHIPVWAPEGAISEAARSAPLFSCSVPGHLLFSPSCLSPRPVSLCRLSPVTPLPQDCHR